MIFLKNNWLKFICTLVALVSFFAIYKSSFINDNPPTYTAINLRPTTTPTQSSSPSKPPQFVILAFDGSRSLGMWQETLDFAQEMKIKNTPVNFTYFLSGVYFLNYRKNYLYTPPLKPVGNSLIGFADSNKDIEKRVAYVNRAIHDGHEIGSHANGHFDGSKWTEENWQQEFDAFNNLVFSIVKNNEVSPEDAEKYTINLEPNEILGFRAPELGKNEAMFRALKDSGFIYDTSKVGKADEWPTKLENGLWEFPLATIKYASTTSSILSMDYNFYFKQSAATDITKKGDVTWTKFYNATYTSYLNYFNKNYAGNRAPIFIGSHFSKWNDGVYWEAMRDFAQTVCGKTEVKCVTFNELKSYLESNPPPRQ